MYQGGRWVKIQKSKIWRRIKLYCSLRNELKVELKGNKSSWKLSRLKLSYLSFPNSPPCLPKNYLLYKCVFLSTQVCSVLWAWIITNKRFEMKIVIYYYKWRGKIITNKYYIIWKYYKHIITNNINVFPK